MNCEEVEHRPIEIRFVQPKIARRCMRRVLEVAELTASRLMIFDFLDGCFILKSRVEHRLITIGKTGFCEWCGVLRIGVGLKHFVDQLRRFEDDLQLSQPSLYLREALWVDTSI